MAKATILTGARAKILINGKLIGLFANCTWSVRQSKTPVFILGRFSPAEITPTSQEPVSMNLSGYRVVGAGPYKVSNATMLKDLLNEEDFSVTVVDRQTGKAIFVANGCRVTGWNSGVSTRGISDLSMEIVGLMGFDESSAEKGGDGEASTASKLTDGQ
jgi:hypothetical protein